MAPTLRLAADFDDQAGQGPARRSIRVALADRHGMVRRSLRQLLEGEADIEVVADASDLQTIIGDVATTRPDVLVVDLRIPNGSAVQAIQALRERSARTEVVVITMEESPLSALRALEAGATGFVVKHRADSELLTAIRAAARGDEYVSSRVADGVDALRAGDGRSVLGPRETDILRLIALGHTSGEIARQLHLSRRTVEAQRARIYQKLGLGTRAELVKFALRRHLIG